ncbi:ATP-binding protein [Anaeromyxobacter sp. Fw109-5]|uniref:sensor histidine kinase n=1 Tax=Anaeromyxobacter sp. (strain Fw109-5) TaxID=404589 RepID=UPI0000ED8041|nr:ATP-binding protein [Anaeromyxobacter sp. Fw109-5]ABS25242.1 multi-sensor signal transduction histidine kinase [Anaeromyxobacter sp. Fw109-5]
MRNPSAGETSCRSFSRLSIFSKMGALAGILDYEEALAAVARLSIPELADWCIVDEVGDGEIRRMEVAHRDPARASLAAALRAFPLDHSARRRLPAAQALRSGRPLLLRDYGEEQLQQQTEGEYLGLAAQMKPCSVMVVPVSLSATRVTVTFVMSAAESGRRYGEDDLALAEELVRRAAQIVDSARVHHQLRRTEERFRVALAHSGITLFEQDLSLRYRWMYNPPLGYRVDDVLGRTNAELLSREDASRLQALDDAVLRSGRAVQQEVRITAPGGEQRHLLVTEEPLRDASGAIVGLTGAATDITDQKRAQEELARALVFREQVMGILGHDLRNPLGAVRALASLLLRRGDVPASAHASLGEIDRAARRMLEMIGTLLDFTDGRFKGALPIAPVPADLHEVCQDVIDELRAADPRRTIQVALEGDGRGTWDPARLAQVVSNLVANALEHGVRGAPVRVTVRGDHQQVAVTVENQGAIPPELRPVLFEPFCSGSRLRDASHARGLGLGLYIVDLVVRAHGGSVSFESTAERGTAFTVRLPRAAGVSIAAPREEAAASPA